MKLHLNFPTHLTRVIIAVPWRNGEDVGLVYQGSAVRAPPQEIFHSNSGIAVLQKAWNSALDYSKNIIIIIIILKG